MTQEKELELYKAALVDWEKPIEEDEHNFTQHGLCWYFDESPLKNHFIGWIYQDFEDLLPTLYKQRMPGRRNYHYPGSGSDLEGRSYRVKALKKSIAILEKTLKR